MQLSQTSGLRVLQARLHGPPRIPPLRAQIPVRSRPSSHSYLDPHPLSSHPSYNDSPIRTTLLIPGQVLTPLFASLPPLSRPVSFLAPLVHPTDLAASVIDALDKQQSREIFLPFYGNKLWVIKGLPSWARDGLVWVSGETVRRGSISDAPPLLQFSGANEAMREFVKTGERKEKRQ